MTSEEAIFAGGCFWCTEAIFKDVIGVEAVESGYIGGDTPDPTYREVCSGATGHAEAVRITFDPGRIGYGELLDIFFATHDPTQLNRQGNDVGTQYRSAIFPRSPEQRREALAAIERAQANSSERIVTKIENGQRWYRAEDYHQDYWHSEGRRNPYCIATIPPKLEKLRRSFAGRSRNVAESARAD